MTFIVNGYDYTDDQALARRQEAREAHLEGAKNMKASGTLVYAVAMLNEEGNMCGSTMIMEMENRQAVDAWLDEEPYVKGKVWERVEVIPCAVPPLFR